MNRIFSKLFTQGLGSGPSFETVNLVRATLAFKYYAHLLEHPTITADDNARIQHEVESYSDSQLAKGVQESAFRQVVDLFQHIHSEKVKHAAASKQSFMEHLRRADTFEEDYMEPNVPVTFSLECKPSLIPNAGEGVFLRAKKPVTPGTVLALYPGLVHLKEHLRDSAYLKGLLPDSDFMLMTRIDQNIIDGRTVAKVPSSPYALGHKINHCGASPPNVMQVSFDYPIDLFGRGSFPEHLRYLVPNAYATPPSLVGRLELSTVFMRGMVFISTRPLEGDEELVMDYRLYPNKDQKLPDWYVTYNSEDSRQRWSREKADTSDELAGM